MHNEQKVNMPRVTKIAVTICTLFIVHFSFTLTVHATSHPLPPLNQFCFTEAECKGEPYRGTISGEQPECLRQDSRYLEAGYKYYCYAPSKPYRLQVPLLGAKVGSLEEYVSRVFQWLVGVVGVVAGIMIVWAGVKWLTAAGSPDRISDARKKIADAAVGLILVLSSYLILQTINPALVRLQVPPLRQVRQTLLGKSDCVNRQEFSCGETFQCTPPSNDPQALANPPCPGGIKPGECLGQYCAGGGVNGCLPVLRDRIVDVLYAGLGDRERGIIAVSSLHVALKDFIDNKFCLPKQCPGACSTITDVRICASPACNCIVTDENADTVAECRPKRADGQSCSAHAQCTSGICNFAVAPNVCGSALSPGQSRPNWTDCQLNLAGFCGAGSRCVDTLSFDGDCTDGSAGSPCNSRSDCDSGFECHDCNAAFGEDNKCGPPTEEICNIYSTTCVRVLGAGVGALAWNASCYIQF